MRLGRLSGLVPLVGVASGFCFAGNAALLGICDIIVATATANVGMAGPAMIKGAGLGSVDARAIGPASEQHAAGVVDVLVGSDAEAADAARQVLGYFQGSLPPPPDGRGFACADQRLLRGAVPENRRRGYEMRTVVATIADSGSWLELRRGWAPGQPSPSPSP